MRTAPAAWLCAIAMVTLANCALVRPPDPVPIPEPAPTPAYQPTPEPVPARPQWMNAGPLVQTNFESYGRDPPRNPHPRPLAARATKASRTAFPVAAAPATGAAHPWRDDRGAILANRLEWMVNECRRQALSIGPVCDAHMQRIQAAENEDGRAALGEFRRRLTICRARGLEGADCEKVLRGQMPVGDIYAGPKCPEPGSRKICLDKGQARDVIVVVRIAQPAEAPGGSRTDPAPSLVTSEGDLLRQANILYSGKMRFTLTAEPEGIVEIANPSRVVARDQDNPVEPFHVTWKVLAKRASDNLDLYVTVSQLDARGNAIPGANPRRIPVDVRVRSITERLTGWLNGWIGVVAALGLLIGALVGVAVNLDRLVRGVRNIGNAWRGKPSEALAEEPRFKS